VPGYPSLSFNEVRRRLELLGFVPVRQKRSHVRHVHEDGRKTTLADHGSKDVPKGLLTKIVWYDLGISVDEFMEIGH
jgi:predicted RNA binding protein YcfA (HicA-like mRNA interferase family)